eukprot:Em0009g184a
MTDTPLSSADEASIAECQKYLSGFRVQELKELLKSLGCGQSGKKGDLYMRSMDMLQSGNLKVRKKIREISHKATESKRSVQFIVKKKTDPPVVLPATTLPGVVFKAAPFYERITTILGPVDLVNRSHGAFPCFTKLQFSLTLQELQLLYPPGPSGSSQHSQVLVRFCRKDSMCPQDDQYPPQCSLKANDINCPLPGYHPLKPEPKSDTMKTCSPVNITHCLKSSTMALNHVGINWCQSSYSQFCVAVELSRPLSVQDMLHRLISKGLQNASVTQSLVKQKLATSKDGDISATTSNLRVSLLCPLGRMRMEHPCRSDQCSHLQCFDAKVYLQMNEKKARWVCPVCDKLARFETLVIDNLFLDICDVSPTDDVEFLEDGTWHPVHKRAKKWSIPEKNCIVVNSPYSSKVKDEKDVVSEPPVIDLTLSDEDEGSPVSHASSSALSPAHRIYVGSSPIEGGIRTHAPLSASLPVYVSHSHVAAGRMPVLMQNKGPTLVVDVSSPAGPLASSLVTRTSSGVVSVD